jgi:hypothetical protein
MNNGALLNIAHIIETVMSSATEAELAGLYIMACKAIYIRIILKELGHLQPPTPLQTDSAMADRVKSHGHEIPLATQSRMPTTILHILATWKVELCQLLDKTSPRNTSL